MAARTVISGEPNPYRQGGPVGIRAWLHKARALGLSSKTLQTTVIKGFKTGQVLVRNCQDQETFSTYAFNRYKKPGIRVS